MVILINPISENIEILVIDIYCSEVRHDMTIPRGRDYDEFPDGIIDTIDKYEIEEIWCILGPGAFTRMRIVTLTINTLSMARRIQLRGAHFFDIVDTPSPILKANDREYITKNTDGQPCLIRQEDIIDGTYTGYGDQNHFTEGKKLIEYEYSIAHIIEVFRAIPVTERVVPIYLKDPHITWSKKNI